MRNKKRNIIERMEKRKRRHIYPNRRKHVTPIDVILA